MIAYAIRAQNGTKHISKNTYALWVDAVELMSKNSSC